MYACASETPIVLHGGPCPCAAYQFISCLRAVCPSICPVCPSIHPSTHFIYCVALHPYVCCVCTYTNYILIVSQPASFDLLDGLTNRNHRKPQFSWVSRHELPGDTNRILEECSGRRWAVVDGKLLAPVQLIQTAVHLDECGEVRLDLCIACGHSRLSLLLHLCVGLLYLIVLLQRLGSLVRAEGHRLGQKLVEETLGTERLFVPYVEHRVEDADSATRIANRLFGEVDLG
mmetsp:Transcript_54172/g.136298  ORF Transcript_54172/g.136298 Transcript_54172/m.136298 type:complete len:231 (+) Transcript_54172:468-1160(+)